MRGLLSALRGRPSVGEPGIGMFAGSVAPQALSGSGVDQLRGSMAGDPGLRLASSRGRRVYRGGALVVQQFAAPQGGPATDAVLAAIPLQNNAGRRSVAFRGTPTSIGFNGSDFDRDGSRS